MINRRLIQALGPGLMFAAISVGVSHLVQSTRAGALYGLAMLVFIFFGLLSKYPASRFGQQYAVITGTTLLEGFRKQGKWSLVLVALITSSAMFTGVAAVTLVTAGIAKVAFGLQANPVFISACILTCTMLVLLIGKFHWLDISIKILVIIMACSTLLATFFALPSIDWSVSGSLTPERFDLLTIMFIVGLVGWMPVPLDTVILQSIWTVAKARESKTEIDWKTANIDFHIGYFGTAFLAVCFLLLGTALIHGTEIELQKSAAGFAAQLIGLYQQALGDWTKPIIAMASLAVMMSTVLTLVDGYPRSVAILILRFRGAENPAIQEDEKNMQTVYLSAMLVLITGAICIQMFFISSFTALIGFATAISFITAPIVAFLIHKAITDPEIPLAKQPGHGLRIYSLICILILAVFALCYIYLLLTT
ncbi:MAG: divalent metal cation transporter [Gammaproteobacteria bacterium]|nr:divalent metal cation transporter [Gammaproteobacteria bacterium]